MATPLRPYLPERPILHKEREGEREEEMVLVLYATSYQAMGNALNDA